MQQRPMFANPLPTRGRAPTAAYRDIGAGTAVDGASPHHLVSLLYGALADRIHAARGSLARGDVPAKAIAISSAVRIVEEGLAAPLNLKDGGEVAARLADLYDYLVRRLTLANLHSDLALIDECDRLVKTLREAWDGIADHPAAAGPAAPNT
jgi:flagellar protein FliS